MSSVPEEIQQLQLRILELEKQQKEKNENDKKTSIDHNFNVINEMLTERKHKLSIKKFYTVIGRETNQVLVTHLEAVYNILQIVDERLKKLEDK
jgi:hypothetical protein